MSVNCGVAAVIDAGQIYDTQKAGLTVAFTCLITSVPSGVQRLVTKWGGDGPFEQSFAISGNSGRIAAGVRAPSGGNQDIYETVSTPLTNGALLRCVMRFTASQHPEIFLNGAAEAMQLLTSNGLCAFINGASQGEVNIGMELDEGIDGLPGNYSEVAIWAESLPTWMCLAYTNGFAPSIYPQNGLMYIPLTNVNDLTNRWGNGAIATNTSGTNAVHPSMKYPSGAR